MTEKPIVVLPVELRGAPYIDYQDYGMGEVLRHYTGKPYLETRYSLYNIMDKQQAEEVIETQGATRSSSYIHAKVAIYPGGRKEITIIEQPEYDRLVKKIRRNRKRQFYV